MSDRPLKIWFTEIGEPLPIEGDHVRLYRYGMLTKVLAERGHDVTWWTSNFTHAEHKFVRPGDSDETVHGVKFHVLKGPGYKRNISLRRFYHQAHFARRFAEAARRAEKPDIIVSPIPTLNIATEAVRYGRENNVPVVTDIRDEWPDELLDLVPKPMRWAARLVAAPMYRQMSYICRNVAGIMGISRRQLEYGLRFAHRAESVRDGIFSLGYTAKVIPEDQLRNAREYWKEQGVDESRFIVCLFSSINNRLGLKTVFEAARKLEKEFSIQFVLCGTGSGFEEAKKASAGIESVLMPGWVDGPKIAALMEISDVGLAPYAKDTRMSLPNKPFEYFSGGLAVVSSIEGELADILDDNQCGRNYSTESVDELCTVLKELKAHPALTHQMGENALKLYQERFSGEITFRRIEEHLHRIVDDYQSRAKA